MLKSFLHIDLFIKDFQYYSNIFISLLLYTEYGLIMKRNVVFGQRYCLLMTRNCLIGQLSILSTSIGPILQEMSTYVRHASRSSLSHILLLPF